MGRGGPTAGHAGVGLALDPARGHGGEGAKCCRDLPHAPTKIDLIPHGIPDVGFVDPTYFKDQFGVEGRVVLLTFGLLSPNKGIEYVLNALPHILEEFPDVVYIVLSATHPNELREHGGAYQPRNPCKRTRSRRTSSSTTNSWTLKL